MTELQALFGKVNKALSLENTLFC